MVNPNILDKLDPNKITLLNIENFDEEDFILKGGLPNSFLTKNRVGGGIICAHKDIFEKWYSSYYQLLEYFIKINRFIGKDQSIMATLCILDKDLINLVKPNKNEYCQDDWFYLEPYLQGLI